MNKKRIYFGIAIGVVLVAAVAAFFLFRDVRNNEDKSQSQSQLTGLAVDSETADRPILAVIIENTPPARPQTGLNNAGIVFEAVTEGGITRYLALYQENQPEVVGPVRSLRVDTMDWVMGFDASVAHVGGRPEALDTAEDRGAKSLSQFIYPKPYYRTDDRSAPHNMYARTADLRDLMNELGHDSSNFASILRSDENPVENPQASTIRLDFSGPDYLAEFRYDAAANAYTRYLAGSPHISDDANDPITVKNLVVITLPADRSTDDGALGEGEALVFKDGSVINARWEKQNFDQRIKIVDSEGSEISLNRGKTWIAATQPDQEVTY